MIIVTGGLGFIGSHIAGRLADAGKTIVVSDFPADRQKEQNLARHAIAEIVHPDMLATVLKTHQNDVEAIIHMGAISDTTESNIDLIVKNNIRLTLDLVDWCARHQTPFIYASSAATYGDGAQGFYDDEKMDALMRLAPLNAYGWSKHIVDRRIANLKLQNALLPPQCVGLKFFNVYGPNEYHKGAMRSVVHQIFPDALSGKSVRLFKSERADYADGGQLRDFVYVRDCVDVIMWFLNNRQVSGLFNLGTGKARSFADLAKAVFAAINKEAQIEFFEMPEILKGRYQYFTEARMSKLSAAGCPHVFTSLEDGVRDYVQNYLCTNTIYA